MSIPETVVRELDVPAAFAGADGDGTVTAEVVYSNERIIWVEPTSGVIVTSEESPNTVLRGPEGTTGATILAGDFAGSEQTISDGVERAEDIRGQISMVKTILPLAMARRRAAADRPRRPAGGPPGARRRPPRRRRPDRATREVGALQ